MVSAEKGEAGEGRAVGKRSRGASPNGHYGSDFSDDEREGGSCTLILTTCRFTLYRCSRAL